LKTPRVRFRAITFFSGIFRQHSQRSRKKKSGGFLLRKKKDVHALKAGRRVYFLSFRVTPMRFEAQQRHRFSGAPNRGIFSEQKIANVYHVFPTNTRLAHGV